MTRSTYVAHASLWILLLAIPLESTHGWLVAPPAAAMIQQTAAGVILTANLLLGSPSPQLQAMLGKELQSQLQAPTDDRPQIQIPSNQQMTASVDKNAPIVEALLYLANPQSRPGPLDTIVITVRDVSSPDKVLAGAKIPVSKTRFPVQLRLFSQNIIDKQAWDRAIDVVVRAVVCPSESASFPCSESEATMKAEGVAKLIRNIPGLPEGTTVRAGASLPLK